ncbi:hypothetical protein [Saccharothrix hoggarensis]|uniref:Uncharacterized protein n=1 Tax=Saccharothrix hoggarensis TaxID=913853 RepID=A0ABW3R4G3_9PSEU
MPTVRISGVALHWLGRAVRWSREPGIDPFLHTGAGDTQIVNELG